MKRFCIVCLCLLTVLSVTACSGNVSASSYTPAVLNGNSYTSTYLGLTAQFPSDYVFCDNHQLGELNGFTWDPSAADFKEKVANAHILYDLYAADNNGNAVDIQLENLTVGKLSVNSAAEYAEQASDDLKTSLESMGYGEVTTTVTEIPFAGGNHTAINAVAKIGQFSLYQTVVCIKLGDHVARITAGSFQESTVTELLSAFQPL